MKEKAILTFLKKILLSVSTFFICFFFSVLFFLFLSISPAAGVVFVAVLIFFLHNNKKRRRVLWGSGLFVGLFLLLAPMIPGALINANALRVGNNGKNIVHAIISANMDRATMSQSDVWPSISADFSGEVKDYTRVPDSEAYFADLIKLGHGNLLSWFLFCGAGIPVASDAEIFNEGGHNVWNVIAGLDADAPEDTPFLFTQNLDLTIDDLRDENVDLCSKLDNSVRPFGDYHVVVVQKSGAMVTLKRKQLTREKFLGSSRFDDKTNRNAVVLKTKTMSEQ